MRLLLLREKNPSIAFVESISSCHTDNSNSMALDTTSAFHEISFGLSLVQGSSDVRPLRVDKQRYALREEVKGVMGNLSASAINSILDFFSHISLS